MVTLNKNGRVLPYSRMPFCPSCGSQMGAIDKFCRNCGTTPGDVTSASQPQENPTAEPGTISPRFSPAMSPTSMLAGNISPSVSTGNMPVNSQGTDIVTGYLNHIRKLRMVEKGTIRKSLYLVIEDMAMEGGRQDLLDFYKHIQSARS